jgi:hypothetical protein
MDGMRTRKALQISLLAAALILGFPETFNGLSVLVILLAASAHLLQPGALIRVGRPALRLVK